MEIITNAIAWAEIPVTNFDRAKMFYSIIYDYEMPEMTMGDNRMGILLYDQQNNGIGAAIVQGGGYVPKNQGVKIYLNGGTDLNTILQRVEKASGKVVMPKVQISPELGYFGVFEDSEGNHISLHSIN